jgi:hypothetical protein
VQRNTLSISEFLKRLFVALGIAALSAVAFAGCGSKNESSGDDSLDAPGLTAPGLTAPGELTDAEVEEVIGTLLEAGLGQRGEKTEANAKAKFLNLTEVDGKGVGIDVWWGRPDEQAKAASVAYGESSDWIPAMLTKGFSDNPDAVYTVTEQGTGKELWTWDRWSADDGDDRLIIFSPDESGAFTERARSLGAEAETFDGKAVLPPADAGQVRVTWNPISDLAMGESLLAIRHDGACRTNGSGVASPDGSQNNEPNLQLPVGAVVDLVPFPCEASAKSEAQLTLPSESQRGVLLAYKSAGAWKLDFIAAP